MYEYKVVSEPWHAAEAILNMWAAEGWRLVTSTSSNVGYLVYTLEREV